MTALLRKVSLHKWEQNKGVTESDFTADSITGCTRTNQNTLSVWHSDITDFEQQSVIDLIVGLATTMEKPDPIDLIWLDNKWLAEAGIEIEESEGNTKFAPINSKHRDLCNLNYGKLAIVGRHIVDRMNTPSNYKKISKTQLIQLVNAEINKGDSLKLDVLSLKWQEALNKIR